MNKYLKALENIGMIDLDNLSNGYDSPKFVKDFYYGEYQLLQELVDKATPKKPIKDEVQDIRYVTKYICPNCGGKFTGKISDYCYHCGQAFDWSE